MNSYYRIMTYFRLLRLAVSEYDDTWHKHQPHIHYIKGISKEVIK